GLLDSRSILTSHSLTVYTFVNISIQQRGGKRKMRVRIDDLEFDEGNEDEMASHHVQWWEVRQVLDSEPVFLPNKKGHRSSIVMIGPTDGGRFLTIPLSQTGVEGRWRPATAWDSSKGERTRYDAARSHRPTR